MSARKTRTLLAVSICSMLLLFSLLAAPVSAGSKNKPIDANLTEHVGPIEIPVSSLGLDYEALAELIGMLPDEMQGILLSTDSIYLDGTVHVNLKVWEKGDGIIVHLQAFWHGTIALLDSNDNVLVELDAKNVQIMVHAEVPSTGLSEISVFANVHLNGELSAGDGAVSLDLKAHVLLRWDDGGLTMFKIWLPDLGDLAIA